MKSIRYFLIAILAIPSIFLLAGCSRTADEKDRSNAAAKPTTAEPAFTQAPPKSLIVAAGKDDAYAPGIQQLLERHRVPATILPAVSATRERARGFDLVIVVGQGRYAAKLPEFDQPVLGVGCCGCNYFGSLRLKNGSPWT
jgi:hypothetical protein